MNETAWQYRSQAQAAAEVNEREPTVAEAIDRALANGEQQRVRLMKLRGIMENMDMLDKPVHELHNLFMF